MARSYRRKTGRPSADRSVRVRYERREQIDTEKVAEVLIRLALRQAGDDTEAGRAGDHLRRLLTSRR